MFWDLKTKKMKLYHPKIFQSFEKKCHKTEIQDFHHMLCMPINCAGKLDFLAVYDIKWGYAEWTLHTLKVLL